MTLGLTKSKIVIFKNGRREIDRRWKWKEEEMEVVDGYKYLEVYFGRSYTFKEHKENKIGKGCALTSNLCGIIKRNNIEEFKKKRQIFETLVSSSILFGAEIWSRYKEENIEIIRNKYIK